MPAIRSIPVYRPLWKLNAVAVVAILGVLAGLVIRHTASIDANPRSIDWTAYDKLFRMRPAEDRTNGPIVLIAIDDYSLNAMQNNLHYAWPWPREAYAKLIDAANEAGAREV